MNTSKFSLEFELNVAEIQKLNKMYYKDLYKERVTIFFALILIFLIFLDFFNLSKDEDLIIWELRNLVVIILFLMFRYSFVNAICKTIFRITKKITNYTTVLGKYKLNFTNSFIYVHSPLGAFAHKWSQIERAVLTKDFFFLYVKDDDHHIISISNKFNNGRNINELIAFVERNVVEITKM